MMIREFIARTGFIPTAEEYADIKKAYMEFEGDKNDFCKAFSVEKANKRRIDRLEAAKNREVKLQKQIEKLQAELDAKNRGHRMKIKERRIWSKEDIRRVCIDNELYTHGTNEEYERMLENAGSLEPFAENLYIIAKDIEVHSTDQTVSNIMCLLANKAVRIIYEIGE